jgi:acetylornithine/N-succinyldiaminopimelate aminotransferase
MDRVFFTNSGAEAIEGAIKLARKYAYQKNPKSKGGIIAMNHSFHGRTMGALSVTGTAHYREPFEPLIGGVKFAEYNDMDSIRALTDDSICAVILETIQGEGGIHPAQKEFLQELRTWCDEKDILLILDEIQCGMGRSGSMFAYQQYGIIPDIMTSAKALGCGVPIGAFGAREEIAAAMVPGDHGSTYGGNPLATSAACQVFTIFAEEKIVEHVNTLTPYLEQSLRKLASEKSCICDVRGMGFIQGIELNIDASDVINKAMEKGLILISAGKNVIRIVPPLIAQKEDIDVMCQILSDIL